MALSAHFKFFKSIKKQLSLFFSLLMEKDPVMAQKLNVFEKKQALKQAFHSLYLRCWSRLFFLEPTPIFHPELPPQPIELETADGMYRILNRPGADQCLNR